MAFGFGADELFAPIVAERALRLGANANNPALTRKEAATLIRGAGLTPCERLADGSLRGGDPLIVTDASFAQIRDKVRAAEPLSLDDGVALYAAPEPAGGRRAGQRGARAAARRPHLLQPQPAHQRHQRLRGELHVLLVRAPQAGRRRRLHDVARGGLGEAARARRRRRPDHRDPHRQRPAPGLPFDYYTELLAGLKRIQPTIHLKAFTAVEIFYFAKHFGMPIEEVLRRCARPASIRCRAAAPRSSRRACARRSATTSATPTSGWRSTAPRTGWGCARTARCSTGHIETVEERVDHMLRLRALQDETGGFQTFIPLAFHPDNNALMKLPAPTGVEDLRTYAVARLMLHNIPHIKAYWIMLGVKTAQTALWFGADDLDGTVQEERIYHMAGAETPQAMTPGRDRPPHPQRRPHAGRARHALQRRRRGRRRWSRTSRSGATCAAAWRSCRERRRCKIRIAAVSFLNARPITYGLEQASAERSLRPVVRSAVALRRAAGERGEVDLGADPGGQLRRQRRASCASSPASPSPASAPVRTVLLVGEVPWAEMKDDRARRRLAQLGDAAAAALPASAASRPRFREVPHDEVLDAAAGTTGALVIGDAGFAAAARFRTRVDLGAAWRG